MSSSSQPPPQISDKQLEEREHSIDQWKGRLPSGGHEQELQFKLIHTPNHLLVRLSSAFTELIYDEVIDWEERSKNGVTKEDCSG
jgi:hypothetical protein